MSLPASMGGQATRRAPRPLTSIRITSMQMQYAALIQAHACARSVQLAKVAVLECGHLFSPAFFPLLCARRVSAGAWP